MARIPIICAKKITLMMHKSVRLRLSALIKAGRNMKEFALVRHDEAIKLRIKHKRELFCKPYEALKSVYQERIPKDRLRNSLEYLLLSK